jgi:hypothetical protein
MLQVIDRFDEAGISSVCDVVDIDSHQRNDLLKMDAQQMCVSALHDCWLNLTLL